MDKEAAITFCESLFAKYLDGNALMSNASHLRGSAQWIRFPLVMCKNWVHWLGDPSADGNGNVHGRIPVVLMGDAAHTAHFSIGSGTKLAFEDAIDLARAVDQYPGDLQAALADYQALRSVEVLRIQNAARNSTEWFENVARYVALPPEQFAYSLLTRSQRISHENLRLRDRAYVQGFETWFADRGEAAVASQAAASPQTPSATSTGITRKAAPPMFTAYRVRGVTLPNRIVVSPMAQYSAVDGVVGDYHLAHLGARAMGGAGLVMVEMTCTSADARITPGCPVLDKPVQCDAFRRIVDFVHTNTPARIGIQLGHAGAKGSTRVGWDGMDQPLAQGNWPLISASRQQYLPGVSAWSQAMTRADMDRVLGDFVRSSLLADEAGFDWLELHCAHGYLLSSFLSPLTNRRMDDYGGDLTGRLRYPLEVFKAVRSVWPTDKPISVRISAHDWVAGGNTADDAVAIARAFKAAGADMIDCSSGQVSPEQQPVYGRMYQTPFADRVRNEAGIATIAVGAITDGDQANSIIAAGRADLCAIGRPHLANPAWTLTEAARLGYTAQPWPRTYTAAKSQLERGYERDRALAAQANAVAAAEEAQ
jgi:anthraniloyl-CoA monooxygenase